MTTHKMEIVKFTKGGTLLLLMECKSRRLRLAGFGVRMKGTSNFCQVMLSILVS